MFLEQMADLRDAIDAMKRLFNTWKCSPPPGAPPWAGDGGYRLPDDFGGTIIDKINEPPPDPGIESDPIILYICLGFATVVRGVISRCITYVCGGSAAPGGSAGPIPGTLDVSRKAAAAAAAAASSVPDNEEATVNKR